MDTLTTIWNVVVEYRVTIIALVTTVTFIGLKSYVARCEKLGKTDGRFYFFAVTALPFLNPNRPGGTGQLSGRVAKLEDLIAPVAAHFPRLVEVLAKLEPLLTHTGPPTPAPTPPVTIPPPDVR